MKNECNIIRDILPLYSEDMVSEDTKDFVGEHLAHCPQCCAELENMKMPVKDAYETNAVPMKALKRKLFLKKMQTVLCTMLIVSTFLAAVFAYLTAPQYFRYAQDLVAVSENADGTLTVNFDDRVTGYHLYETKTEVRQGGVYTEYNIEAWTTTWDQLFQKRGPQNAVLRQIDPGTKVYYVQNYSLNGNEAEDVLLYGKLGLDAGRSTMPGLTLFYWLILAGIAFVILSIVWLIFRKRKCVRKWIETMMLLPVSYAIGYTCVCGFSNSTYSKQRDFFLIIMIAILVYCAILMVGKIYRAKKELREMEQ